MLRLAVRVRQRPAPENSHQFHYALQRKEPPTLNYFNNFSIGIMKLLKGVELLQVCYETYVSSRHWRFQDIVTRVVDHGSPSQTETFHAFSERLAPDQIHSDARNMCGNLQSAKKSVEGFGYAHQLWSHGYVLTISNSQTLTISCSSLTSTGFKKAGDPSLPSKNTRNISINT